MKTIATFGDPLTANLAKARLADAGIDALLANEQSVGMAWHLTNAIGGIRLQVTDEAAEEAIAILAEKIEPGEAEAAEAADELDHAPSDTDIVNETESDGDEAEEPNLREQTADRALRGALFCIFIFPVELYVFYQLLWIFNSKLPMAPRHRRNAIIAAFINLPCVLLMLYLVKGWVLG